MRRRISTASGSERDQLEELSASLAHESLIQAADLRAPEVPAIVVAATLERFGRLDLLVNNAGATKRGDFFSFSDDDWIDGFALKFYGAMRCSRAAWPHLQASGGSIVNIAGIGCLFPLVAQKERGGMERRRNFGCGCLCFTIDSFSESFESPSANYNEACAK